MPPQAGGTSAQAKAPFSAQRTHCGSLDGAATLVPCPRAGGN